MIHLTVAAPLGIDSVFFSFIQRLADQNGHVCVLPTAQQLDEPEPGGWIEAMRSSGKHHFVIGYRYPPRYWKQLSEHAATVALLADGDGIARQVELIHQQQVQNGGGDDLTQCLQEIRHAVDAMVGMTEWLMCNTCASQLLVPAFAFHFDAGEGFRRMERFYQEARVPVSTSCWQGFSIEAKPLLDQIQQRPQGIRAEIHRMLSTEAIAPSRLQALEILFGKGSDIRYHDSA